MKEINLNKEEKGLEKNHRVLEIHNVMEKEYGKYDRGIKKSEKKKNI